MLFLSLLACTSSGGEDTALAGATLTWLAPQDGETIAAGEVECSLVTDNFVLTDPAKHNEGTPVGYIEISIDGAVEKDTSSTTPTLTLAAGAHELTAQLFLADGDEVLSDGTYACEEGDTSGACEAVVATITVTAE